MQTANNFNHTPWMRVVKSQVGQKETPLPTTNNPAIVAYHAVTRLAKRYWKDETPWCASFASWVLSQKESETVPFKTSWARDFLKYGTPLAEPVYGCLVIYDRGNGKGHVHFYEYSENGTHIGLGGNQDNKVCSKAYLQSKVLGYRWPVLKSV